MSGSLQDKIERAGGPVNLLSKTGAGSYVFPVIPEEYTSWQIEQRSWMETCALMDQSYHMTDLFIQGPDALKLVSDTGINKFSNFKPGMAKQHISCSEDGYVIGDNVMCWLPDGRIMSAGIGPGNNWMEFQAATGNYDVEITKSSRTRPVWDGQPIDRELYRFQIQGPHAVELIKKLSGKSIEDVRFFRMTDLKIGSHHADALRHGMAGAAGLEFWGPYDEKEAVLETILKAGEEFGLVRIGARAYVTSAVESGWMSTYVPGIYSGDSMKTYREWLPETTIEAYFQLAGSFYSDRMEDYYKTPFDTNYDPFISFDHDFIGRDALQTMVENKDKQRKKVTLEWNGEDVGRIFTSLFTDGPQYKYPSLPMPRYGWGMNDRIELDGRLVGLSTIPAATQNERRMISIASIDRDIDFGTEVELVWGERPGTFENLRVEPHDQTRVRAIVSPSPYTKVAREEMRASQTKAREEMHANQ